QGLGTGSVPPAAREGVQIGWGEVKDVVTVVENVGGLHALPHFENDVPTWFQEGDEGGLRPFPQGSTVTGAAGEPANEGKQNPGAPGYGALGLAPPLPSRVAKVGLDACLEKEPNLLQDIGWIFDPPGVGDFDFVDSPVAEIGEEPLQFSAERRARRQSPPCGDVKRLCVEQRPGVGVAGGCGGKVEEVVPVLRTDHVPRPGDQIRRERLRLGGSYFGEEFLEAVVPKPR